MAKKSKAVAKPVEEMEKDELITALTLTSKAMEDLQVALTKTTQENARLADDMHARTAEVADLHVQLGRVVFESVKMRKPKRWAVYSRCSA